MKKHRPRQRKPKPPRIPAAAPAEIQRSCCATAEQDEPDGEAFYHGGPGWLNVGDFILPRGLSGAVGAREDWPAEYVAAAGVGDVDDEDFVHVTANFRIAVRFAVLHKSGNGKVFRVIPEGKIEPDPTRAQAKDCWRCTRAQIVAIEVIPYKEAQRIRAERPKNFDEAAELFEKSVQNDVQMIERAREAAVEAGIELVAKKVRELILAGLSPDFITNELFARCLCLRIPGTDPVLARALSGRHWEEIMRALPAQAQPSNCASPPPVAI